MIYVCGDTHGQLDWGKLSSDHFPLGKTLTEKDYVIITGDFGGVWQNDNQDRYVQKQYTEVWPWTTLFVDGNHENHVLLNSYPVTEWNGGLVHMITPKLIHLMRGQVYTIDGKKIFTLGGAQSHDMWCRTENKDWWRAELPTADELYQMLDKVEEVANSGGVDYIITHCAPDWGQDAIDKYGMYEHDILTNFLDAITDILPFKRWYCGHYHIDHIVQLPTGETLRMLYNDVVEIESGKKVNYTKSNIIS